MRKEYEIFLVDQITIYPDIEKKYIEYYLNKITYKNDVEYCDINDDVVLQCLAPIICCIVRKLVKRDNPFINDNFDLLIRMINVEKITNKFVKYSSEFIPIAEVFLSNLDAQAELTLLFCNNYVWGLVNRIEKGDKNIVERMIKLKLLNEEIF